jgi:hypothetical protein
MTRPCPICQNDREQAIAYFVCKPCGIAFDIRGNPAPEGSLDIPDDPYADGSFAQLMAVGAVLAARMQQGKIPKDMVEAAFGGLIAAMQLSPANVAREAVKILAARQKPMQEGPAS